ncbi:hypothetical protein [Novosphingobium sp. fls2-241-R2A-195]|uniref:hypothetical protein n=1 Tax=Novosphingobium sp. fls2-241-R2A-195 TaxID=3040296 RepID=UPI00254C2059|nr:hypothetical protein [Novosphingobium sp. fls2-241-R2A-195]
MPRIAWWMLLLMFAVAAIIVQLDRQAKRSPAYTHYVPAWFPGNAQANRVVRGLNTGHPEEAMRAARLLLTARPVPSENMSFVAMAAAQMDDSALASSAILEAAGRGWRDVIAQSSMLDAALKAGEPQIAAQRLDALLRLEQSGEVVDHGLRRIAETEAGREALLERLKEGAPWIDTLLRRGSVIIAPEAFSTLLENGDRKNIEFPCDALARTAISLLRVGQAAAAEAVWRPRCEASTGNSADDVSLSIDEAPTGSPFAWTFPDQTGLFREQQAGSSEQPLLHWSNSDVLWRALSIRYTVLPPGRHTMRVLSASGGMDWLVEGKVRLEAICFYKTAEKPKTETLPVVDRNHFVVPPDCAVQLLSLEVGRGDGTVGRVEIQ